MIVTKHGLTIDMKKFTRYTGTVDTYIVAYALYNNGTQYMKPDKLYMDCSAYAIYDNDGVCLKFQGKKRDMVRIASWLANNAKKGAPLTHEQKVELLKVISGG